MKECFTNIHKHAQASKVELKLKSLDGQIVLSVEDNGVGVKTDRPSSGFGIASMKDRASKLGGTLKIERTNAGGTLVQLIVPNEGGA